MHEAFSLRIAYYRYLRVLFGVFFRYIYRFKLLRGVKAQYRQIVFFAVILYLGSGELLVIFQNGIGIFGKRRSGIELYQEFCVFVPVGNYVISGERIVYTGVFFKNNPACSSGKGKLLHIADYL